jgi:hypothetical protein
MTERKTSLTNEEKIKVAFFHLVKGYPQHDLAALFEVNAGRVAEAVTTIRTALNWSK